MKTNKTSLMIASVISALALISPLAASAAPDHDSRYSDRGSVSVQISTGRGGRGGFDSRAYWNSFDARISEMRERLDRAHYRGSLTNREYRKLNERLDAIAWQKTKFQRSGGLNPYEASIIDEKLDHLSADIRYEKHDGDRGYGYGRDYHEDHGYGRGY